MATIHITIIKQDITETDADAVLCLVDPSGKMNKRLAKRLKDKGGASIESAAISKSSDLEAGKAVGIDSGNLRCKWLIVVAPLRGGNRMTLEAYRESATVAIKEAHRLRCASLAISGNPDDYPFKKESVFKMLARCINEDAADLLLGIVKTPQERGLREVIFTTDRDPIPRDLKEKLSFTPQWPKARKLSFLIDAPNYKREGLCKKHMMSSSHYRRHLKEFSEECYTDLQDVAAAMLLDECKIELSEIEDLRKALCSIHSSRSGFMRYLGDQLPGGREEAIVIMNSLTQIKSVFENLNPAFVFLRKLIPDEKFTKSGWRRFQKGKTSQYAREKAQVLTEDYESLQFMIRKTNELKRSSFPVDLLSKFWPRSVWKKIMSKSNGVLFYKLALSLVEEYHGRAPDTVRQVTAKKKPPIPTTNMPNDLHHRIKPPR